MKISITNWGTIQIRKWEYSYSHNFNQRATLLPLDNSSSYNTQLHEKDTNQAWIYEEMLKLDEDHNQRDAQKTKEGMLWMGQGEWRHELHFEE